LNDYSASIIVEVLKLNRTLQVLDLSLNLLFLILLSTNPFSEIIKTHSQGNNKCEAKTIFEGL